VPYLQSHTILDSGDLDEAREFLSNLTVPHDFQVQGDRSALAAKIAAASFGGLNLIHFGFGDVRVDVSSGEENDDGLLFYVVTGGSGEFRRGNTETGFSVMRGVIRDQSRPIDATEEDFSAFVLPLSKDRLQRHACAIGGIKAGTAPVQFDQSIDMATPGGRQFRNTVHFLANSLEGPLRDLSNPIVTRQMEEMILTQVLTLLPNSLSDAVTDNAICAALPYHVKRARDHIHAHAHEAIGVADIATAAGCGYRTVQNAFNNAYGMSPMAYLRLVRLRRVRSALLESDPESGTIAQVARAWGFGHMGRFSDIYRRQFGELPSETLRKSG
jgi:AraC-like DNA-binding protein